MNSGLACLYFANMKNVEYVYGYEPFPDTFRQALDNFTENSLEIQNKIRAVNLGLTDKESQMEVLYDPSYTTNMRVVDGERAHGEQEKKVCIKTMGAATEIRKIIENHQDMKVILKIDCEGSEYPIFKDLDEAGILKDIHMILMETHDGRENEIKAILRKENFIYFDNYAGGATQLGFLYAVKD